MTEKVEYVPYSALEAFKPHFRALAKSGYFKLIPIPKPTSKLSSLHLYYRMFIFVAVIIYNLQHIIKAIQVIHSTDQVVNILFILLTTLNTLGKQLTFNYRSPRIDKLIAVISGPVFAPQNRVHEEIMKENAVTMNRLLNFYICCIYVCGSMWCLFPIVNRYMGEEVEFTAYFPFNTTKLTNFSIIVVYMTISITWQAYGNVTMDCTIVAFYAKVKVQLQILRHNLEHLCDTEDLTSIKRDALVYKDLGNEEDNRRLHKKLVQCVVRHLEMKWFVREVEAIFAEALLFQFLIFAWVICMTVYKIVGLNILSAEFLSMAMYLGCMLAQLYLYCYYGTQVKYESEFVNQSIYSSDWISLSPNFRRNMLILMEVCKVPITPRTAYIVRISLETYIAVLRASYTLYTFLDRK